MGRIKCFNYPIIKGIDLNTPIAPPSEKTLHVRQSIHQQTLLLPPRQGPIQEQQWRII